MARVFFWISEKITPSKLGLVFLRPDCYLKKLHVQLDLFFAELPEDRVSVKQRMQQQ